MFTIGLTIACAVFVIGYIFFSAGSEQEASTSATSNDTIPGPQQDAA